MSTRINLSFAISALSILALLSPLAAMAQRPGAAAAIAPVGDRASAAVCERIDEAKSKALAKLAERAEKVKDRGDSRNNKIDTRRDARLEKLENHRQARDNSRDHRYDSLKEKANTDEKKAAVLKFIETVEDLVAERRAAIDAAIKTFEDGVVNLKKKMQETTDSLRGEVESDLVKIFDEAKAACDAGKSAAEVRAVIASGMKEMQQSRKDRRNEYSFRDELQALREARRAAFGAAMQDFKEGMEAAKTELRAAFAKGDDDSDDDNGD